MNNVPPGRLGVGLASVLLALGSPVTLAGQDCRVDDTPDHADWHDAHREKSRLKSGIADRARQAGLHEEIRGWVFVMPGEDKLNLVDTNLPGSVQESLPGLLAEYFASPAIESESLSLALDAPEIPLWPDRTETCPPVLENAPTIRALIATILEGRPRGALAFQPRSVSLLLYVDHTGRSPMSWWTKAAVCSGGTKR